MTNKQILIDKVSRQPLSKHLEVTTTFWQRFVGMMFRKNLPAQFAIWIIPCKSIHTMWMRVSIDVFFINKDGEVISIRENIKPWRFVIAPKGTHSVLETVAGSIQIQVGTILEIVEVED